MKYKFLIVLVLFFPIAVAVGQESNPYVDYRKETYEIQKKYLQEISEHQKQIMEDMEVKLAQQRWQTTAIAIMVLVMVSVGLYLSYLQFKADAKNGTKSSVSLKIGAGSFEINSSVIGLIIIALSFWFFHTYIDRVYSVEVFNIPPIDFTTFGVNK